MADKRYFINQNDTANKFWQVETAGATQTVTFGKIGTAGRQSRKEYATEAECRKETENLIASKLKKGYVEVSDGQGIPPKPVLNQDELYFWEAIKKSNKWRNAHWSEYDIDEHLERLTNILSTWNKQKLIGFERILQKTLQRLYTASIAELDIILESPFKIEGDKVTYDDYLSDDGFLYFRCWLILKGKAFVDDIAADINTFISGKYSFDIADVWGEGLLYVTDEAYAVKTGSDEEETIRDAVYEQYPELNYDSGENSMDREPKGGSELQQLYPELVKEMAELRSE